MVGFLGNCPISMSLAGVVVIPVELGNLTNLNLYLHQNELSGVPVLSNLTHLSLSRNELSGGIPVELGNLSNLTGIIYLWNWATVQSDLQENQLSGGIPVELGNLENLEWLTSRNLGGGMS